MLRPSGRFLNTSLGLPWYIASAVDISRGIGTATSGLAAAILLPDALANGEAANLDLKQTNLLQVQIIGT